MSNPTLLLDKVDEQAASCIAQGHSSPAGLPETVYTPGSALRHPRAMVREMLADLFQSRELAWRMFVRDTKAAYRQSYLGYLWIIVPPIASMLLFTFLQSQKILNVGETDIPYPLFVLTGTILWEAFSGAINAPIGMVTGAAGMLSKLNFPREALLLTSLYHILFNLTIKASLLLIVLVWFGVISTSTIVLAPLGMLMLIAFGYMLGLMIMPLGFLYQDFSRMLGMALGFWMLLTPVVYPVPTSWPASLIGSLNPVTPLVITTRQMMTTGDLTHLPEFLIVSGASVVLLLIGWVLYRVTMPHLVARMSA